MLSSTWKALLVFFKKPQENIALSGAPQTKIKILLSAYLIFLFPVLLSTSFFMLAAEHLGVVSMEEHKLMDMMEEMPVIFILLLAVILAPLWEELLFRLPLRWPRAYIFKIFLLPLYLGGKVTHQNGVQNFHSWWQKKYSYIFYFTVLVFGLIHIANFKPQGPIWQLALCAPLIVAPQILLGSLLGFIRLRLGFWWSVLLHAFHNLLFVGIALIATAAESFSMEVYKTPNYRLAYEWYEASQAPLDANNQIKSTEVSFEKISVDDLFRFLITNDSSRYQAIDSTGQKLLKLEFKPKASSLDLKRLLVQALEDHLDLSLEPTRQAIDLFEVKVADENKLAKYEQGPVEESQIQLLPDSLIFQNTNLKKITAALQTRHWDKVLRYVGNDYNLYEIRLANTEFPQLGENLAERYGISISGPKIDSIWQYTLRAQE